LLDARWQNRKPAEHDGFDPRSKPCWANSPHSGAHS
jgi:hypothetical protein